MRENKSKNYESNEDSSSIKENDFSFRTEKEGTLKEKNYFFQKEENLKKIILKEKNEIFENDEKYNFLLNLLKQKIEERLIKNYFSLNRKYFLNLKNIKKSVFIYFKFFKNENLLKYFFYEHQKIENEICDQKIENVCDQKIKNEFFDQKIFNVKNYFSKKKEKIIDYELILFVIFDIVLMFVVIQKFLIY